MVGDRTPSSLWTCLQKILEGNEELWLPLQGKSMGRTFGRDARIRLVPLEREARPGDILVFMKDERLFAHRCLARVGGGCYITRGDGSQRLDPVVSREEIIGRVDRACWPGGRWPTPLSILFGWRWVLRFRLKFLWRDRKF